MIKKSMRSWLPLILLLGLLILFFSLRLDKYLTFSSLREHRDLLLGWSKAHYFTSALLFMGCYTLAVAVSIPGAVFLTLAGGFLFGVFWGTVLVVFSATLGATTVFFAVRTSLGNWLVKSATSWLDRMRQGFQKNAFSYLLILRLVPLFPFWVVNIVPALLGVDAKTYIIATFFGIIPGSFVYVLVGNSLSQVFSANQTANLGIIFAPQVLLPLLALVALSLIPLLYKRLNSKKSKTTKGNAIKCDIAIIGAGAGGLSVASVAAQLGLKVVLLESGKMGGDCLNYGCVPSKSLLAAAKMAYQSRHHAAHFGINAKEVKIDFIKVMQHVHHVIKTIAKNDSIKRFESLGVHVIQAAARFSDTKTLTAGKTVIQARRFVIATGSSPFMPPIPGLENTPYLTNETIFDLTEQPKHLVVIGGGPIGCELAQAFVMLGSKVTILEGLSLLPKDDVDCVSILREQLKAMGVIIYEQSKAQQVKYDRNKSIKVSVEQQGKHITITGSHLLIATGRRPNIESLDLEKANILYSTKGIKVNSHLQTSNRRVYALGDVVGSYQFTHVASYHAGIVLRNIAFKIPAQVDYRAIPWVTYTEPEIAHVGILAEEALKHADIQITQWPFLENDRAQTEHALEGKIKVITNKKGKILGVSIIGARAGELILPWVIAIREQKTLRSFTDVIAPYPTLSEVSKQVAGEFYKSKLFSNKTRWLVGWLKKLG
jgi:pyruvate/2-oxoglutarate dehydrogenase complex dihydrolipoamide dehydrogenase (E3) component/uncharacterized membrane protein YdjX (TVP38/TMEM64 family)